MQITLSPVRREGRPTFERLGDALVNDGETFDFSGVPEGAQLPAEAVASDWLAGPVTRIAGELHLALLHGANAPQETLFPDLVQVAGDGAVPLPPYDATAPEEASA
ncbi:hypothetical protein SAMN05216376_12065 [Mameliella alba]|uniref:hypothetical protein n=1 Tax=Mameliella alba TaxID=561184 RepID=UPI00088EDB98|nr:hypothetical protein [Mameliella alba]OWV41878.1 hypothetical protein CDZ96_24380 [Mameliella alba]PTR35562.1 hypothetical protein LX94_04748 [Mameliella alba]GGF82947.1 hypothetical protein GCM10011319_48700 [Mameliella alba]SDE19948.1 hypothetical protein SAMN05216376_12065 [Mameliella alba]